MVLETKRLFIRSFQLSDEKAFIEMASDGSLTEIFGDCSECHKWMGDFIREAIQLDLENNPGKAENTASCKTLERAGFRLTDTRLYQDLYDKKQNSTTFTHRVRKICFANRRSS